MQVQFQVVQFWDVLCYEFPKQTKIQLADKKVKTKTDTLMMDGWRYLSREGDIILLGMMMLLPSLS